MLNAIQVRWVNNVYCYIQWVFANLGLWSSFICSPAPEENVDLRWEKCSFILNWNIREVVGNWDTGICADHTNYLSCWSWSVWIQAGRCPNLPQDRDGNVAHHHGNTVGYTVTFVAGWSSTSQSSSEISKQFLMTYKMSLHTHVWWWSLTDPVTRTMETITYVLLSLPGTW